MYEKHFGLKRLPFSSLAQEGTHFPAAGHEAALATMLDAIQRHEGLMLLLGAPGIGKTHNVCHLLGQLTAEIVPAFLTGSQFADRSCLLLAILHDLGCPHHWRQEEELRLALTEHLLTEFSAGRRVVLAVDEAQLLTAELLEELRLLTNLEGASGRAIQVILVGQPEFADLLNAPALASFRQRLIVRPALGPLTEPETNKYLRCRLESVGAQGHLIGDEALELVARVSQGIPRLANQIADASLAVAARAGMKSVDAEAVLEAIQSLPDLVAAKPTKSPARPRLASVNQDQTPVGPDVIGPMPDGHPGGKRQRRLFASQRKSA